MSVVFDLRFLYDVNIELNFLFLNEELFIYFEDKLENGFVVFVIEDLMFIFDYSSKEVFFFNKENVLKEVLMEKMVLEFLINKLILKLNKLLWEKNGGFIVNFSGIFCKVVLNL